MLARHGVAALRDETSHQKLQNWRASARPAFHPLQGRPGAACGLAPPAAGRGLLVAPLARRFGGLAARPARSNNTAGGSQKRRLRPAVIAQSGFDLASLTGTKKRGALQTRRPCRLRAPWVPPASLCSAVSSRLIRSRRPANNREPVQRHLRLAPRERRALHRRPDPPRSGGEGPLRAALPRRRPHLSLRFARAQFAAAAPRPTRPSVPGHRCFT